MKIDLSRARRTAADVAKELRAGSPPIWVMDHRVANDEILLELVPLEPDELDVLAVRLTEVLS